MEDINKIQFSFKQRYEQAGIWLFGC